MDLDHRQPRSRNRRALGGHVVTNSSSRASRSVTSRACACTHEIAGHIHPAARLSARHALRRPCFVGNGLRLIVPAFGTYTGGLNILDEAFEPLFGSDGMSVWMLGQEGLYPGRARVS